MEALKAVAKQRLAEGQGELDLGLGAVPGAASGSGPLRIVSSRMGQLWDGLCAAYDALGFAKATGGDEACRQLVLAHIIEPTSKLDSLRVLAETGVDPVSYATVKRALWIYIARGANPAATSPQRNHQRIPASSLASPQNTWSRIYTKF